jgi:OmpA-OmpF porin, OOP family
MKKHTIAILLSAFAVAPAVAADTGFYAGAKLGSVSNSVGGISESSSSFGVFGGYTINPNVAFEVGYTDLGTGDFGAISFSAIELSAVGFLPINRQLLLFGKLGMANTAETGFGLTGNRTDLTYGIGGQYNVVPTVGVRVGWERYGFGDGNMFNRGDSYVFNIGGVFKF